MAKEFKRDLVQLAKKAPHLFVHPLKNNLKGYMDCHILNDLVLIYKIEQQCLKLIRLNTHSEVFA
ncbi:type II toxin-antitoxin system mRNA interferase toxin, RelE/StbE family [Avibacterium paragallinarum]|uniref:Type II toxin-antitoxin system YafQ family toxin n=1 Tax=Avibacterium paragallinarum TaxID=728 RepID=A0AAE5TI15_AVIPA|nr:type II toxin-antitoxin system mRNA interferase toxin, RelE/StbE family [Avibacterium paragallinarum]MEE3608864.1 type II toxin-antitoxin system mRNA interferase toxin, RelE/StbE family [Avibacterium paragallinarum]MEE3621668.1 type II toxin-antitoxin system mRNA interferase toxin, RelE/StbE family [Avibacterium paragallinarum]MEE3670000.1 type II toxin-antitoxin system mRNA interferase toxin, RelE/StbE family [Avibacterium paragallinarum]MEE3680689.1 type II toxin-antitoxin system mRNA inte